jgi:hypothetical protein
MAKSRDLPADLIREWAGKHAAANAKLEGRELPDGYVRPQRVLDFLATRAPDPDPSLGLRPVRNANGQIVTWVDD